MLVFLMEINVLFIHRIKIENINYHSKARIFLCSIVNFISWKRKEKKTRSETILNYLGDVKKWVLLRSAQDNGGLIMVILLIKDRM